MLLIDCPYCGERPEPEFVYGGQAHIVRPAQPAQVSAQQWADYLYRRDNTRGVHAERWRHTHGCGRFFNARRDAARYTPNLRATQVELYEGLAAHSQNRWPTLAFDLGAVNDLLAPFIPAGFYYKTFMWPRRAWRWLYEPRIRAAAGLGHSPTEADPDRYASRYPHCDVLIVGA